jgi:hypothetical protein
MAAARLWLPFVEEIHLSLTEFESDLHRLKNEALHVNRKVVVPEWGTSTHGLPDALFGYIMGTFARSDLLSAYWRGSWDHQTVRMLDLFESLARQQRLNAAIAIKAWRHKLMHTSSPRVVKDSSTGICYRWLLHWGDDQLPRAQHFQLQPNGNILYLSLFGLIDDLFAAWNKFRSLHDTDIVLQSNAQSIRVSLDNDTFKY